MELIIKEKEENQLRACYQIDIEFMFGDADGEDTLSFTFSEDLYNKKSFKEEVHDFIKSILSCIKMDSQGRCGFDSTDECYMWYHKNKERAYKGYTETPYKTYQWSRFCEDSTYYEDEISDFNENSHFIYNIPTYADGWYASYKGIEVFYYDENGYKYNVEIVE